MGRGKKSGRGTPNRGGNFRGASFRGGRGQQRGGRGRSQPTAGRGKGRGGYISMDEIELQIQQYTEEPVDRGNGYRNGISNFRARGGRGSGFSTRGMNSPRGRGRGRGIGSQTPNHYDNDSMPDRGRGSSYVAQRGRSSKNLESKLRAGAPLSKLLYEDRPLLRPIVFVRSVYTATLFQKEEDILQAPTEQTEDEHVPTADTVTRIFNGAAEKSAEQSEEELEEIDFSEIGRIQAEVDAAAASLPPKSIGATEVEQKFTGFYIDLNPTLLTTSQTEKSQKGPAEAGSYDVLGLPQSDDEEIVYVAPHPRVGPVTPPEIQAHHKPFTTSILTGLAPSSEASMQVDDTSLPPPLYEPDISIPETTTAQENHLERLQKQLEASVLPPTPSPVITSEATVTSATPVIEAGLVAGPSETISTAVAVTSSTSIVETGPVDGSSEASERARMDATLHVQPAPASDSVSFPLLSSIQSKKFERRADPLRSPRSLINKTRRGRRARKVHHFGSFGAMLSETQLWDESGREMDPRRDEQRRGDSDVDWGDDEEDEEVDRISGGMGGMDLDGDLDPAAMSRFVQSMGADGSRQVTMDDVADIERIQQEDEDAEEDGDEVESEESEEDEDEDVDMVVRTEERLLIAEDGGGDDDDDDDDSEEESEDEDTSDEDDDEAPSGSFQARLDRIRKASKGKQRAHFDDEDDNDDLEMALELSWAEQDEAFHKHIQTLVDENDEVLSRKERKQKDKIFHAIYNGKWNRDEYEELVGQPAKRGKDKFVPPELREQWQKDREKKAENKQKRALARTEAAADPLVRKKGGKKSMKAALAAMRADPSTGLVNRVTDLVTLEQQIRRFLDDIGGPATMALPPADKETRAQIHELANAFNLTSRSKGSGNNRYTSLIKTTMSGIGINEKKVRRILRTGNPSWEAPNRRGKGKVTSLAKHKEGEEVGKAAPKIDNSNIGFQMLAAMGWAEGDRIGLSGGLDVPLVAVMKKTKLGLGAAL